MSDMVRVPAEKIDALRRAVMLWGPDYTHPLATAARAVVDAADTERCPDCGHAPHDSLGFCPNMASDNECNCKRPAPSPARDDAEKAKLTDDEKRRFLPYIGVPSLYHAGLHPLFDLVESVIAAHIGAPGELTALPDHSLCTAIERKLVAERDALRKRIRALADEWHDATGEWFHDERRTHGRATQLHIWIEKKLRELGGDA